MVSQYHEQSFAETRGVIVTDSKDLLILVKIVNARKEGNPIPSIQEMADYFGLSVGAIHKRLLGLEEAGMIMKPKGKARSIQITEFGKKALFQQGLLR